MFDHRTQSFVRLDMLGINGQGTGKSVRYIEVLSNRSSFSYNLTMTGVKKIVRYRKLLYQGSTV